MNMDRSDSETPESQNPATSSEAADSHLDQESVDETQSHEQDVDIPVIVDINEVPTQSERIVQIRTILTKGLLGCLIAAAVVAVIAILMGSMNDIALKAIGTILAAVTHLGILFTITSVVSTEAQLVRRTTGVVLNVSIGIAALSFMTAVFMIWGIITANLSFKFYGAYAVLLFSLLHWKAVVDIEEVYEKVRSYMFANVAFIFAVAILGIIVIFAPQLLETAGGFFGRLLAVSVIIDVTISVIIIVMNRLYVQKHPELMSLEATQQNKVNIWAIILFVVLAVLLIPAIGVISFIISWW